MEKRFRFLRFVSVLLKILACLLLVAGIVAIILGLSAGGDSEGLLSQSLYWVGRIAGVIALLVGLGYFILFWGIAEVLRILLTIEQSSRSAAPVVQTVGEAVSSVEIADVVSARLEQVWDDRLATVRTPAVQDEPEPVVVEVPATVTAVPVPPVVLPPLETAAPEQIDDIVDEIEDEIVADIAPDDVAAEIIEEVEEIEDLAAEVIEEDIAGEIVDDIVEDFEEVIAESPIVDVALDADLPAPEVLDELAEEVSFAEDVEETVEGTVAAVEDDVEDVGDAAVGTAEDAPEEVAEVEIEVEELVAESEPEEVAEVIEETEDDLRQKAKAALDRSLEQAARQMAELESPVSAPVAPELPEAEDDLADIVGIGPVFRVRLRQAGITSFSDLAAASVEQLAELTEQSVERIENEDWIGQAEEKLAVG